MDSSKRCTAEVTEMRILRSCVARSSEADRESGCTRNLPSGKIFSRRSMHRKFTTHPQVFNSLTSFGRAATLDAFMHSRRLAAVLLAAAVIGPVGAATAAGADDVTLLRVFLTDGTSLVS